MPFVIKVFISRWETSSLISSNSSCVKKALQPHPARPLLTVIIFVCCLLCQTSDMLKKIFHGYTERSGRCENFCPAQANRQKPVPVAGIQLSQLTSAGSISPSSSFTPSSAASWKQDPQNQFTNMRLIEILGKGYAHFLNQCLRLLQSKFVHSEKVKLRLVSL